MFRKGVAVLLGMLSVLAVHPGHAFKSEDITFSTTSISGNNGMSFVYLQASDSHGTTPVTNRVPTARSTCPVPYYSKWDLIYTTTILSQYSWKLFYCQTGAPVRPDSTYDGNIII